jgi:hypothetical protein
MKFTFLLLIPTISASSASCWLRLGRNPYGRVGQRDRTASLSQNPA